MDGGVFVDTSLYRPLESGELLPKPVPLPGSDVPMNFVIVADDAFPLTNYMIKPFPNRLQKGALKEPLITDFPVHDEL